MSLNCGGGYSCALKKTHSIIYNCSPIICQIKGGNQRLTIPYDDFTSYSQIFDGRTYSYDPDASGGVEDRDHLEWNWGCHREEEEVGIDCSDVFSFDENTMESNCFRRQNLYLSFDDDGFPRKRREYETSVEKETKLKRHHL